MPEVLRSAKIYIQHGVDLPISPSIAVEGKGTDGRIVCKLYINAAGVSIHGPRDAKLCDLNWDDLVDLAKKK